LTGPAGKGPWVDSRQVGRVYQCDYQKEYSVNIPAGKHDIVIQNMGTDWVSIIYFVFTGYSDKVLNQEFEEWKSYATHIGGIGKRIKGYKEEAEKLFWLKPGDINYDLVPTLRLQIENLEGLAANHTPDDFNMPRTEQELKEILEYAGSGKDYFKLKKGRIKIGYLSTIDNTYQPYDVLIPKNYDPSRKYALILSLHGYQKEIRKWFNLVGEDTKSVLDTMNIIKVALYGRRNHSYLGAAEEDVLAVLHKMQSRYSIDPDRVYLTGSSMGGYGTWFIGLNYPDLFAAISPACPPSIMKGTPFVNTISPIEYIANAQNLPARIYHGAMDSAVNVNNSRQMVGKLKELNYDFVYKEYPDVGHDVWNQAEADSGRLPWLLNYTRNLYPAKIRHKAFYLRYGKAYWLQITGKDRWNEFSEIQGEVVGANELRIHTDNVSSFFVDLRHPSLKHDKSLNVVINGKSLVLDEYSEGMDFHAANDSTWVTGKSEENGLTKRLGMEGPFFASEMGRFLFVYGTGKPDKVGLLKKIGILLQKNYSDLDMEIRLVPDTLAIQDHLEETNNLYLIGSPDANLYLKQIVTRLPLSFSKDSLVLNGTYSRLETGVQMIYPNPLHTDKYVCVDIYPEFIPDTDQFVNYPVADYLVYSLKGGKFEILKDEYFGSDWQVVK
jgi:dienelactone hydrolase